MINTLPQAAPPGGAYTPVIIHNGVAYVSAQLPRLNGEVVGFGKLGAEVSVEQGKEFARLSALQCLAALQDALGGEGGLSKVVQVLRLTGYVATALGFTQISAVNDGASECVAQALGERGRHARTSIGVAELPRGVAVEVELTVAVSN